MQSYKQRWLMDVQDDQNLNYEKQQWVRDIQALIENMEQAVISQK